MRGAPGEWRAYISETFPNEQDAARAPGRVPSADELAEVRARFPILGQRTYLDVARAGLLSTGVAAAIDGRLREELERGRASQEYRKDVEELRARVRHGLAATVAAPASHVALVRSTTEAVHLVFTALRVGAGDEVVVTDSEHAAVVAAAREAGASLRVVALGGAGSDARAERVAAAVGPRTRLVAVSEVLRRDGSRVSVERVAEAVSVPVLVDGAQAAGAVAVDASHADFYAFTAAKWLCGPEGVAALYVGDPDSLPVAEPSVFSYKQTHGAYRDLRPRDGAARFDPGAIPAPLLAGAERALAERPSWHLEQSAAAASLLRSSLGVTDAADEHAPVVALPVPPGSRIAEALAAAGVDVSHFRHESVLRISCGYWTSAEDVAHAAALIATAERRR